MLSAADIEVERNGMGMPFVLLHCLGVDHRFWDFTNLLDDKFQRIRYDFPGHGRTPVPSTKYEIADLSKQLAELLDRQKIAKAHIAGISLGGLVAQHFAATYADRVARLVLIDTTPRYTGDLRRIWDERAAAARQFGTKALIEGILKIWFSPEFISDNPPAVRYVREQLASTSAEGYALACEALASADLRALASSIAAPTLVVCGNKDIPSFIDSARWLTDNIPNAEPRWIEGGYHASVLEKPNVAVRLLDQFLSGADSSSGERASEIH